MKYSRIRLYHPPPNRTKVADISGWMIKPVGPNSSSKSRPYCENNQIRWCRVALLHCVDLCPVSRARVCPGSQLFLSLSNLSASFRAILREWNTIAYVCKQVWLCSRTSQSGRYNRRAGWYIQRVLLWKNSVPAENGWYKRLDDISVADITGFYCIGGFYY